MNAVPQGYMSIRRKPLTASDDVHEVTLAPPLVISGKVTDAATGKPVKEFRVVDGMLFENQKEIYWSRDEGVPYQKGEYSSRFTEPVRGRVLKVVASGYQPSVSRTFESEEGSQSFDFKLERGMGPAGVVLLPDGTPAVGAEVGLATSSKLAFLKQGRFDVNQNRAEVVKTDADGRFQFPAQDEKTWLLIALHDGGFAEASMDDLKKSEQIALTSWGRLEGRVLNGQTADSNRDVSFQPFRADDKRTSPFVFNYDYSTKADDEGRFAFERVIPGKGAAARVVVTEFLKSWQHAPAWNQPVEIRPGATVTIQIGGTGRPVMGRVRINQPPDIGIDWTTNEPVTITAWDKQKKSHADPHARYVANILKSGRFRIPDVPAGDYKLDIPVNNPPSANACGAGAEIGRATLEFTVPEIPGGRSNAPVDLGDIEATLLDTLDPGEIAPDFVAGLIGREEGATIRLRNHHGKLVLLDFWASWCAPCIAEMPALKELQTRFAKDPRFVMISLSCDSDAQSALQTIEKHSLPWTQAFLGGTQTQIAMQYTVRTLPATFLIAPDGKVLAKNLRGKDLEKAIAEALKNEKLFASAEARPTRFPVTHFQARNAAAALPEGASVVVLCDSDPTTEKDRPHDDHLGLASRSGEFLWEQGGFHAAPTVSAGNSLAFDRGRQRLYVGENGGRRLSAWTLAGERLWNVFPPFTGGPRGGRAHQSTSNCKPLLLTSVHSELDSPWPNPSDFRFHLRHSPPPLNPPVNGGR